MEMVKIVKNGIEYLCTYQRQGNDKNGNPLYIVNVFKTYGFEHLNDYTTKVLSNCNFTYATNTGRRLDKYGNLKFTSYNILSDINHILQKL
jgi:hypothetical protein